MRISIVFTSLFALFAITTTCIPAQALPLTSHAKSIGVEAALDPVEYYGQGYDDDCYRPRRRYYSDGYYEKPTATIGRSVTTDLITIRNAIAKGVIIGGTTAITATATKTDLSLKPGGISCRALHTRHQIWRT